MQINAKIRKIEYELFLANELEEYNFDDNFDINHAKPVFKLKFNDSMFSVSKWVSPKRTRSYPYARVYNSLQVPKKITIIPVLKDEGIRGDRDYLQWDTVSLMSLLDVYVILAYYIKAEPSKKSNKITNQQFDNEYIKEQIRKIASFHSSALHWNVAQLENIESLIEKAKESYKKISKELDVTLHSEVGINKFLKKIKNSFEEFKKFSREKAKEAQNREFVTIQPKEHLSGQDFKKAKITITNFLGGEYYFTCDEVKIVKDKILLIEGKHSQNGIFPSIDDIKDGLLKMILYTNLEDVTVNNHSFQPLPTLKLTAKKINLDNNINLFEDLMLIPYIIPDEIRNKVDLMINLIIENIKKSNPRINEKLLKSLFKEAITNKFNVIIEKAEDED